MPIKKRFSEGQIAFALRQLEAGASVQEVIGKMGISGQTFYNWKGKCGGPRVSELRKLKQLVTDLSFSTMGLNHGV